jgi:hypothetical protein
MANSKKKCRHCKEYSLVESGITVPIGFFCSIAHAQLHGSAQSSKARASAEKKAKALHTKEQKAFRSQSMAAKESLKTAGDYIKEAQIAVNKYIRARDSGKPCISCGNLPAQKFGGTMDAGHYRSRGAAGHLRFNTFNIHSQCVRCNRYKSGNAVDYRLELINRIGVNLVDRLEADNEPKRFTIDYLKRVKRIFNKRARRVDKIRLN